MKKLIIILTVALLALTVGACGTAEDRSGQDAAGVSAGSGGEGRDGTYVKKDGVDVIYLAGGCFWGTEKLMQSIDGVVEATSGYANGEEGVTPDYYSVSDTGFKETVRVEYRQDTVSLDAILFAYFRSIDPTLTNRQGNDQGTQYQVGIYWTDDTTKETVLRIAEVEKGRYDTFAVEIEPLKNFYNAEDYHQDYLTKNPGGYCHVSIEEIQLAEHMIVDPADYKRPSAEEIKAALTDEQYAVTQAGATEPPFQNAYWDNHEKGIYVDIVTGEPLFSSSDKFDSGTGWPSFSKGIDENALVLSSDLSMGMVRTEVRSRAGNSHLGHAFYGEDESPSGVRFCINSAALNFVAYGDMDAQGYGYLKEYVTL